MEQNIVDSSIYKIKRCLYCKKEFYVNIHSYSHPKYCSNECRNKKYEKDLREFNLKYRNAVTNKLNENSIEGIDYVECPICHEKHAQLSIVHFRRHGYSNKQDVLRDFPNLKTTCQKIIDNHLKGDNNPMSKSKTTELQRKQSSPYSLEHYLKKYNGDEVLAHKELEKFLNSLDRSNWNYCSILYYLNKGYTLNEAHEILREKHVSNGLEYYINKYGEKEGTIKYNKRIKNWCKKLQLNFIKNGDNRTPQSSFAKNIIFEICNYYNIEIPKKEKYISDGKISYAYDFTYKHKIIEFNGDYWHCNPLLYDENFYNKSKQKYAKDIWEYDKNKKLFAEKYNYKVLIIWEYDYITNKDNIIKQCIEFFKE